MIWALASFFGAVLAAIVVTGLVQERRRRATAVLDGTHDLPDRCLSHEIDHLLPGVLNWTHRDGTFRARRRPEDSW